MQGIVLSAAILLTGNARIPLKVPGWSKYLFGQLLGNTHQVIILWWIALTLVFAFVVHGRRYGNCCAFIELHHARLWQWRNLLARFLLRPAYEWL
jgi:ribose/xylose/arabinose/galactoside ABC-type transport system permease subunit